MAESPLYKLGRLAGSKARKARWVWNSLAGNETEAIRAEYGVGRDMAAVVREQRSAPTQSTLHPQLEETLARLATVVRNKHHRFEVEVVVDEQPTAYALPGGFIFVTESLAAMCDRDDDELAFVIGHEMAHVIRRHAINRVLRQTAYSAASMLTPGRGVIAPWLRQIGLEWLEKAYSRDHEFEADELGARLARAAGFDPEGAIRLFSRFQQRELREPPSSVSTYLASHPPVKDRIDNLKQQMRVG